MRACRDIPSWRAEPFNSSRKPLIQWLWRQQQTQEQNNNVSKQSTQQQVQKVDALTINCKQGKEGIIQKKGGTTHNNTATVQAALRDLGDECVRHFHKAEMLVGSRVANIIQCSSLGCLHTYVERQKGGRCGWLGVWGWVAGTYHHHALNFGGGLGGVCGCVDFVAKQAYVYRSILVHFQSTSKDLITFLIAQRVCDDHQATGERQHWIDCGLIGKHTHSNSCQFVPPIIPPKTRQTTTPPPPTTTPPPRLKCLVEAKSPPRKKCINLLHLSAAMSRLPLNGCPIRLTLAQVRGREGGRCSA